MSDDQDFSKRPKKRGGGGPGTTGPPNDYKPPKKGPNKDYQIYYEYKGGYGYDRPPKDQSGPSKGGYNSQYDDYSSSRPPKQYNDGSYKPKGNPRQQQQRRQGPDHGPNFWKKKTSKISKETVLETFARVEVHKEIDNWVENYRELFVKERQEPVNDELIQLDANDGLMNKAGRGPAGREEGANQDDTNPSTASSNSKAMEMFDFAQDRIFDPIQALKERLKKDQGSGKKEGEKGGKEEEWGDELLENEKDMEELESGKNMKGFQEDLGKQNGDKDSRKKGIEGDEDDGEQNFSNIDEMFEEKLKNNEIIEPLEDAFEELLGGNNVKKEKLAQIDDDERRPLWEDVDTNKMIEDIKKEDFLSSLPQDKSSIFGSEYTGIRRNLQPGFSDVFGQFGNFEARREHQHQQQQQQEKPSSLNNFDIDFSKFSFDPIGDDFPIKHEDLFPSPFILPQKPVIAMTVPTTAANLLPNPSYMNPMGFAAAPLMQQGNIPRPIPQPLQMQQLQQMPQIHPMHPMQQPMYPPIPQIGPINQIGPVDPMGGNINPKFGQFGVPGYMGNQLPPYKREPGKEGVVSGFQQQQPRHPPNPSIIFQYFSRDYEDKVWYYIDLQKRTQGPFSGRNMDEWYYNGHLPLSLEVTIGKNSPYKSLKELADIIINNTLKGDSMYTSPPPMEPQNRTPPQTQQQQGFSGIADLLKNRPDLAQISPGLPATALPGKAKTLDEIEKSESPYPPQYEQPQKMMGPGPNYPNYGPNTPPVNYQGGSYPGYYQKGNMPPNYGGGDYHHEGQQMYYHNPRPHMANKRGPSYGGNYPGDMGMRDPNMGSPDRGMEGMNQGYGGSKPLSNSSPTAHTSASETPSKEEVRTQSREEVVKPVQDNRAREVISPQPQAQNGMNGMNGANGASVMGGVPAVNPLQALASTLGGSSTVDITMQLKNILGLGAGNLGNLGGIAAISGNNASSATANTITIPATTTTTTSTVEVPQKPQVEKQQVEKPKQERQQEKPQQPQYHHQEKLPQQQSQRKGSKAPKIDTSDFPSLTETYK